MDPVKWFSAALRAAERLPQNFGTADQMAKMLSKYGAKQSELNYLKVPQYLDQFGGGRVAKSALYDYIDKNKVLPSEVVKRNTKGTNMQDLSDQYSDLESDLDDAREAGNMDAAERVLEQQQHIMDLMDDPAIRSETKYSDYATYPDSGYKETLLTLPQKTDPTRGKVMGTGQNRGTLVDAGSLPLYQSSHWDEPNVLLHMRTSNPSISDLDGGRPSSLDMNIPFLEELQSDWGQAGRKQGFKDDVSDLNSLGARYRVASGAIDDYLAANPPAAGRSHGYSDNEWLDLTSRPEYFQLHQQQQDIQDLIDKASKGSIAPAPLVANTNDWASAGVRRFLMEAAQQDAPQVAWTTGAQQSARYQGHAPEGMAGFYDKMLPNLFSKYLKPYGGSVTMAPSTAFDVTRDGKPVSHFLTREEANNYVNELPDHMISDYDYRTVPVQPGPHTATLPPALRDQLLKEGIPFFRKGGLINDYSSVI